LDGLRGVAILGVLAFHTGNLAGGFLGVDLFFALSGYLITDLLLREIAATGRRSLLAFWGRRLRRLFPALAVMLAGVALLVAATRPADLLRTTAADGPWVQLDLINWHLLAESAGYWDRFGAQRTFEHLWSIAVEEQFYLVWPVLVAALAAGKRVAAAALGGSAVSLVLMVVLLDPADPSRVYTGTDTRAFSLLLGALAATEPVRARIGRIPERQARGATAFLALGIALMWLLVDGADSPWLFRGGLFLHSAAAASLIALCVRAPRAITTRALAARPLTWLGKVSYSLYLWHWPVIVLLAARWPGVTGWVRTALAGALSVALAAASTYLVEDPIRFRAAWARGRAGLLAFVAAMAALAALWWALPAPAPVTIDVTELSDSSADHRAGAQALLLRLGPLGELDVHLRGPRGTVLHHRGDRGADDLVDPGLRHVVAGQRHVEGDQPGDALHEDPGDGGASDLGVQFVRVVGDGQQQRQRLGGGAELTGRPLLRHQVALVVDEVQRHAGRDAGGRVARLGHPGRLDAATGGEQRRGSGQDSSHRSSRSPGRHTTKRAPPPALFPAVMSPPCRRALARAMDNPRPLPGVRVRAGSLL
jgi:peptidoglycan/LPS O-acetylase OafA/YrhL